MLKGLIFDFDGVIAESVQIKTEAFASLYDQYGTNVVNKVIEHHEENGGMSRFEKIKFYHNSFLHKMINNDEINELANQFSKLVVKRVINSPYVPGVIEYIEKSYNHYDLFISTGTPTIEIKQILQGRNINHYFTDVFGSPEEKTDHLNQILFNYHLKPNEMIFYGDSKTDYIAAKNTKIPFVLIKNSFNNSFSESYKGEIINNFKDVA